MEIEDFLANQSLIRIDEKIARAVREHQEFLPEAASTNRRLALACLTTNRSNRVCIYHHKNKKGNIYDNSKDAKFKVTGEFAHFVDYFILLNICLSQVFLSDHQWPKKARRDRVSPHTMAYSVVGAQKRLPCWTFISGKLGRSRGKMEHLKKVSKVNEWIHDSDFFSAHIIWQKQDSKLMTYTLMPGPPQKLKKFVQSFKSRD